MNIQLAETKEGNQLWSERFDTERRSMLQVQDEIVGRVSRAIGLKVVDIEARRSRLERQNSTELMDLILRGKAVLNLPSSPATMIEARGLFEQALTVQPNDVDGLAGVASTLVFEFLNGYYETEGDQRLQKAERLLDRAGAIEPGNIMVLKAKAALRRAQGKFDDAIAAAQAIITENPGEPWAYKEIGLSTLYLGQAGQALDWFAKADRTPPHDPGPGRGWTVEAALILLDAREGRPLADRRLDANPKPVISKLPGGEHARSAAPMMRRLACRLPAKTPRNQVSTFRRLSPVPLVLTSQIYQQQLNVSSGLRGGHAGIACDLVRRRLCSGRKGRQATLHGQAKSPGRRGGGPAPRLLVGAPPLFRDCLAGAAKLGRKILQLGQAVPHGQHRFGVVDMHARSEGEARDRRREHIDQAQRRMMGQEVSAALRTILTLAVLGLLELCDMLGPGYDLHGLRHPHREGVYGRAGPRSTGAAVAIAHGLRGSGDLQLDGAAKATSNVIHGSLVLVVLRSEWAAIDCGSRPSTFAG